MKRNRLPNPIQYIDGRLSQLEEDKSVCLSRLDKMWYNRLMQELEWAKQSINGEYQPDCVLSES